jgi:hypothetical protein
VTRRGRLSEAGLDARLSSPSRRTPDALAVSGMGPLRTCVGCRSVGLRSALLRAVVVTDVAGQPALIVDVGRRMPGRGAWLHPDLRCLERAEHRRAFPRALRHAGPLDVQELRAHLERTEVSQLAGPEPESTEPSTWEAG